MAFQFREASCVVVGTFNIYVFQPDFFVQSQIIEEGGKAKLLADFSQPGFKISFEGSQVRWIIRPDRIMAESNEVESDCGAPVANILKALPWTPISAIGLNFEFSTSHDDFQTMAGRSLLPATELPVKLNQQTAHLGIEDESHLFNLTLAKTPDRMIFGANVHTQLKSDGTTRLGISAIAEDTARRFSELRQKSIELARDLLGVEIADANHND